MNNNIRRLLVTLALGMGLALALLALGLTLTHARTQNSISMTRITVASDTNRDSNSASMSADGALITFFSDSDLLGQGIPDEQSEIWLYDTTTLTYTRVTTASSSDRDSSYSRLSADGTTIVFSSDSDFLGQGIPAGQYETWLYDVPSKILTRVTTASSSGRGSWGNSLSADGTLVAISSDSDFLGQGIPAGQYEIWLYDTTTLTYTRVTTASESNRQSFSPHLNAGGTLLAFHSDSDLLGQGISDDQTEIWLYDIPNGELTRVTYGPGSDRGSYAPYLSADGTQLAFISDVDFWGQGISQYQYEVWLYDVNGGILTRVTTASESNRSCDYTALNADGTRLAFQSDSDYLGQGIPQYQQEIWLYDIPGETFTRVTESGTDRDSAVPSLSADGTLLAFHSDSDFLGQGIQNGQNEVWLFGLPLPAPSLSKEVDDETPRPGQRVTFTLSVVNPYTTTLTDAVISDTLPAELSFAGPVSLDPSQPGAVLADDAGDLPTLASGLAITAETAVTLTFPVTVSDSVAWGTIITNTASLASTQIPTPTFGSVVLHVMFHVASADPASNSHDAALDTDLFFTANSAVSATSVTTGTVFVHGDFQGHLDGSFSFGSVTFDPAGDLHPGELVQASVTGDVLNGDGEPIAPYVWEFRAATQGGAGVFIPHPATPSLPTFQTSDAALGDLDGDGDLDALLSSAGAETVWLNDGAGGLTPHPTTPSFGADSSSRDVALGDLNGDGSLDALVANALTETVWLNDGAGNLTPHPTTPSLGAGNSSDVELGDLDRDGDLDALVLYSDQADYVWLNDGAGNLTPHPTTPTFGEGNSSGAKLGDLDGDGDLDAVIAKRGSQLILVWGNDGAGNFYFHNSFGSRDCYGLELGDLDGDGDLDAVTVYDDRPSAVWLNDGAGHFAAHPITPEFGAGNGAAIALGDVDGDGDLDALVARDDDLSQTVWLNDGAGNLTAGGDFGAGYSSGLALGDLDGDGDLDVVVSDNSGLDTTVWLNEVQEYEIYLPLVMREM